MIQLHYYPGNASLAVHILLEELGVPFELKLVDRARAAKVMRTESRPRPQKHVLTQRAEETVVLLDVESGEYYALNDVGGRVWELCDGTRSVAEIVAALIEEYDAPAASITVDVMELLGELTRERLLVTVD